MSRRPLEICLWLLAVVIPSGFLWLFRRFSTGFFTPLFGHDSFTIIRIVISPVAVFVLLALRCRQRKADGIYKYQLGRIKGAMVGAIIAVVFPDMLLWCDLTCGHSCGANIGLGLLFLAMPLYLPLLICLGWFWGSKFE